MESHEDTDQVWQGNRDAGEHKSHPALLTFLTLDCGTQSAVQGRKAHAVLLMESWPSLAPAELPSFCTLNPSHSSTVEIQTQEYHLAASADQDGLRLLLIGPQDPSPQPKLEASKWVPTLHIRQPWQRGTVPAGSRTAHLRWTTNHVPL